MAPPSYADLGKGARDLFNKGYNFGFIKVDSKTKAHDRAEFKMAASHNVAANKMAGSLDMKYHVPKYGLTLTEKWNTDSVFGTELCFTDQVYKGTKVTLDSSFYPSSGKHTGKLKGEFGQDKVKVTSDVSLDAGGAPHVNAGVVVGHEGFLFGYQGGYDTQAAKVTGSQFALGRAVGSYVVHAYVTEQSEMGGSLYHRVNDALEVAATGGYASADKSGKFGLACLYKVDKDWTIRAKVSQSSQVAVATTHRLSEHVKATFSALVNVADFHGGGHKFGVGFEYEPCC